LGEKARDKCRSIDAVFRILCVGAPWRDLRRIMAMGKTRTVAFAAGGTRASGSAFRKRRRMNPIVNGRRSMQAG
jgi:hypothetical protein